MCLWFDREAGKSYKEKCMKTISVSNCTYCNITSLTFGADMDTLREQLQGGVVVKCGMSIEQLASNIYTRVMFEQFRNLLYHALASHIHKPAHPDILPSYRNMLFKDEEVDKFLPLATEYPDPACFSAMA